MSDDEVIKFEITDHDLETEFAPRRGRANKEHQIYGVWAVDSDDEANEETVRRHTRKPKDYTAPIGFVAGGVQQAGKKKEEKTHVQTSEASVSHVIAGSSSEDEEAPTPAETDTAGIRRRGQGMRTTTLDGNFNVGTWEKHTKGIGAKLLLQMGYQPGKGLGKELQGISAPVEATLRKGRGAIGAYGPEKAALKAKREAEKRALKEAEKAEGDAKEKTYHWRKSHKGRYFYRDAADVIQEGKPSMHTATSSELSRVPVIDMTGKEKRVLSGYHALRSAAPRFEHEPRRECTNFALPELTHNLQLMVECCEQDIIENARELHTAEDTIQTLERELREREQQLLEQDDIIANVQDILAQVEQLDRSELTLDDAFATLNDLKILHPLEFDMFGIGAIAGEIVSDLLATRMSGWDPLQEPDSHVDEVSRWQQLLPVESYTALLWHHFIPAIKAAAELWNARVPAPMVRAVSAWSAACPDWLLRECVARCVAPRVLSAVRVWDPTADTQPLHEWVLPWHKLAGTQLATTVYPLIRSRLATALTAWHPADTSAKPLLLPWREAWGSALTALVHQHIVPKLEACLQQAPVELVGRQNDAWLWCVDWLELAGGAALAAVAGRALLPRWLAALAAWLNTNPQHSTVLNSYTTFKQMFPDELLKETAVRDALRKALDMMNRSADLDMEIDMPAPPPPRFSPERTEPSRLAEVISSSNQQKSFSELLESRCAERGIPYIPMPGRSREGRPLYRIGLSMQCYVIRNVVMYSADRGATFQPVSLDKLLAMADQG